ncbi:MAG: hypothetical protein IPG08_14335 [Sphingobacteriaceae bacterium]|nr:hypothetical protein [Sphingobacteriaceae bacterium]
MDDLIYALDAPIWDTSTYAQYRVMRLAKDNGIKVVLDGQGADELFAGYHQHYISKWDQTLRENGPLCWSRAVSESGKTIKAPFAFLSKQKQNNIFQALLKIILNYLNKNLLISTLLKIQIHLKQM